MVDYGTREMKILGYLAIPRKKQSLWQITWARHCSPCIQRCRFLSMTTTRTVKTGTFRKQLKDSMILTVNQMLKNIRPDYAYLAWKPQTECWQDHVYDWACQALGSMERPSQAQPFVHGIAFHWYAGIKDGPLEKGNGMEGGLELNVGRGECSPIRKILCLPHDGQHGICMYYIYIYTLATASLASLESHVCRPLLPHGLDRMQS